MSARADHGADDFERVHICADCGATGLPVQAVLCATCWRHRRDGHLPQVFKSKVKEAGKEQTWEWRCHTPSRFPPVRRYERLLKLEHLQGNAQEWRKDVAP